MTDAIILPGIGGSGQDHWQTHWEAANPSFHRFEPDNWDEPDLHSWMQALKDAIKVAETPPLVIAHSLACLLVVCSAHSGIGPIRGAFLVAVPDPDAVTFPAVASSFRNVPQAPLPFPTLIVASSDDPFGSLTYAHRCAIHWHADFIGIGARGHINADSGLGAWNEGFEMFQQFRHRIGA